MTDAGGSLDYVDVFAGVAKQDLRFAQNGNHLEVTITGQTDKLTINNWFASAANQIEEMRLSDGSRVLASEIPALLGGGGMLMATAVQEEGSRKFAHPLYPTVLGVEYPRDLYRKTAPVLRSPREVQLHQLVEAMAAFGAPGAAGPIGGWRGFEQDVTRLAAPV